MFRTLFIILVTITGTFQPAVQAQTALSNQLNNHLSPYLAMHGNDPVQWQEWNAETVARAKRENKLLFVSSGYFSCHWCHVMQRESFQNKQIAKLINEYFIPVKVDREINAALDARLIDFVERTQQYAGWPLNVFVTPEGYPLVGMVYVPAKNFLTVLTRLSTEWKSNQAELKDIALRASQALNQIRSQARMAKDDQIPDWIGSDLMIKVVTQALTLADEMSGGFGEQNKFPSVPQLMVLLEEYQSKKNKRLKKLLILTLDQMASQGLRDHLGGGFFRYSVDPGWQVPHFEKMLYDNALLAELYLTAADILQQPSYHMIGIETLDFVLRDMHTGYDSYAASLSAVDDKGIEGGYYIWEQAELEKILNKDELAVANLVWQLEGSPDIEHGQHLVMATDLTMTADMLKKSLAQTQALLASARSKLIRARLSRKLPRDDKRIAAWNGLLLSALVKAARSSRDPKYRMAAKRLQQALSQLFWDGTQLYRAVGGKKIHGVGGLEDYAYVSRGLADWANLTGNKGDRRVLHKMIKQAWRYFYGTNGWRLAKDMLLRYGDGQAVIADGPMPSPVAVLIELTLRESRYMSDPDLLFKARQALNSGHTELLAEPFWYASQSSVINRHKKLPYSSR